MLVFISNVGLGHLGLRVDVTSANLSHDHGPFDVPAQGLLGESFPLELGQKLLFGRDVLFLLDVLDHLVEVLGPQFQAKGNRPVDQEKFLHGLFQKLRVVLAQERLDFRVGDPRRLNRRHLPGFELREGDNLPVDPGNDPFDHVSVGQNGSAQGPHEQNATAP